MEELELAIKYLQKRAVSTKNVNDDLMKRFITVLPLSEVEAVLKMVQKKEFLTFYNEMKKKGHPDCV
jgi:SOS response regulatory protein OraA/RecX